MIWALIISMAISLEKLTILTTDSGATPFASLSMDGTTPQCGIVLSAYRQGGGATNGDASMGVGFIGPSIDSSVGLSAEDANKNWDLAGLYETAGFTLPVTGGSNAAGLTVAWSSAAANSLTLNVSVAPSVDIDLYVLLFSELDDVGLIESTIGNTTAAQDFDSLDFDPDSVFLITAGPDNAPTTQFVGSVGFGNATASCSVGWNSDESAEDVARAAKTSKIVAIPEADGTGAYEQWTLALITDGIRLQKTTNSGDTIKFSALCMQGLRSAIQTLTAPTTEDTEPLSSLGFDATGLLDLQGGVTAETDGSAGTFIRFGAVSDVDGAHHGTVGFIHATDATSATVQSSRDDEISAVYSKTGTLLSEAHINSLGDAPEYDFTEASSAFIHFAIGLANNKRPVKVDFTGAVEWTADVEADKQSPAAWLQGAKRDAIAPAAWLGGVRRDAIVPAAWKGAKSVELDAVLAIEWMQELVADAVGPCAWNAQLRVDRESAAAWLQGASVVATPAVEWLGVTIIESDRLIPIEFRAELVSDNQLAAAWSSDVRADGVPPVAWLEGTKTDAEWPAAWPAGVFVEGQGPIAWAAELRKDLEAPAHWLQGVSADRIAAIASLRGISRNGQLPAAWGGGLGTSADFVAAIEWLQGVRRDLEAPAAWKNRITINYPAAVAWLLDARRDLVSPAAWLGGVGLDGVIPTSWPGGISADGQTAVEWGGGVGASADFVAAIEWLQGVNHDRVAPAAWLGGVKADPVVAAAWLQGIQGDVVAPAAWLLGVGLDAVPAIAWLGGVGPDRPVPLQWRGEIITDHEAAVEWLLSVRRDDVSPASWLQGVKYDGLAAAEWIAANQLNLTGGIWVVSERGTVWEIPARGTVFVMPPRGTVFKT